jgi:hypothetical protein
MCFRMRSLASSTNGEIRFRLHAEFVTISPSRTSVALALREHILVDAYLPKHHVERGSTKVDSLQVHAALDQIRSGRSQMRLGLQIRQHGYDRTTFQHGRFYSILCFEFEHRQTVPRVQAPELR